MPLSSQTFTATDQQTVFVLDELPVMEFAHLSATDDGSPLSLETAEFARDPDTGVVTVTLAAGITESNEVVFKRTTPVDALVDPKPNPAIGYADTRAREIQALYALQEAQDAIEDLTSRVETLEQA